MDLMELFLKWFTISAGALCAFGIFMVVTEAVAYVWKKIMYWWSMRRYKYGQS